MVKKLPTLVHPTGYYPLATFQVASDEQQTRSLRAIKKDFMVLGQLAKGSGAQVVSSIPLLAGNIEERNRKTHRVNTWFQARGHQQNSGVLIMGWFTPHHACWHQTGYSCLGGKRILAQELLGLTERALNQVRRGTGIKPGSLELSLRAAHQR